eukprot:PhM_4_TR9127/c0_g1_i1/m.87092
MPATTEHLLASSSNSPNNNEPTFVTVHNDILQDPSTKTNHNNYNARSNLDSHVYRYSMSPGFQRLSVVYHFLMTLLALFLVSYSIWYTTTHRHSDPLSMLWFMVLEGTADISIGLEVMATMYVLRPRRFFESTWYVLDMLIAIVCVASFVLDMTRHVSGDSGTVIWSSEFVNVVRVVRGVVRVMRLIVLIHWLATSVIVLQVESKRRNNANMSHSQQIKYGSISPVGSSSCQNDIDYHQVTSSAQQSPTLRALVGPGWGWNVSGSPNASLPPSLGT